MIEACEDAWWRSMEELVPILSARASTCMSSPTRGLVRNHPAGARHHPHREQQAGEVSLLRRIPFISATTPGDAARKRPMFWPMSMSATPLTTRPVRGCRYPEPAWDAGRIHQHLDIGQGEVPGTISSARWPGGFDGIMTACVFAWEDRADASEKIHAQRDAALMSINTSSEGTGMTVRVVSSEPA